jgi:hypothetical protein
MPNDSEAVVASPKGLICTAAVAQFAQSAWRVAPPPDILSDAWIAGFHAAYEGVRRCVSGVDDLEQGMSKRSCFLCARESLRHHSGAYNGAHRAKDERHKCPSNRRRDPQEFRGFGNL